MRDRLYINKRPSAATNSLGLDDFIGVIMAKRSIPASQRVAPTFRKGCVTGVGYQQHLYHGEHPCETCKEGKLKYDREYRAKNKERLLKVKSKWNLKNKESVRTSKRKWKHNNPDKVLVQKHKRRASKFAVKHEPYTVQLILDTYGSTCYLCGVPIDLSAPRAPQIEGWENGLQLDHVIPLVKGGTDTIDNIKPSHGACNLKKHIKDFAEKDKL